VSLANGVRLGPYEIVSLIGVGGMGEVYRATDCNLKRSVAINVLPALVAGDADRFARFQREAEVLGALNHPNIAAIYGLERSGNMIALDWPISTQGGTQVQWRGDGREPFF
jgi:serine/threonine protein kinase